MPRQPQAGDSRFRGSHFLARTLWTAWVIGPELKGTPIALQAGVWRATQPDTSGRKASARRMHWGGLVRGSRIAHWPGEAHSWGNPSRSRGVLCARPRAAVSVHHQADNLLPILLHRGGRSSSTWRAVPQPASALLRSTGDRVPLAAGCAAVGRCHDCSHLHRRSELTRSRPASARPGCTARPSART